MNVNNFSKLFLIALYRKYAETIPRPFAVRYNPYTSSVEILDSKPQLDNLLTDIKQDINRLQEAMGRIAFQSPATQIEQ